MELSAVDRRTALKTGPALLGVAPLCGCVGSDTGDVRTFVADPVVIDQYEITSQKQDDGGMLDVQRPLRPINATKIDVSYEIQRSRLSTEVKMTNYATLYQAGIDTSLSDLPVESDDRFATVGELSTFSTPIANVAGESRNPATDLTPRTILERVSGGSEDVAGEDGDVLEKKQLDETDAAAVLQAGYRGDIAEISDVRGGTSAFDGNLAAGFEADVRLRSGAEYPIQAAIQRTEHEDDYVYIVTWLVDGERAFGDRVDRWERSEWEPVPVADRAAARPIWEYYDKFCCNIWGEEIKVCIEVSTESAETVRSDTSDGGSLDETLRSRMSAERQQWDDGWKSTLEEHSIESGEGSRETE